MGTGSIHESYAAVLISRSCTGVAVGFCMPAAQIYVSFFFPQPKHFFPNFTLFFIQNKEDTSFDKLENEPTPSKII
jgi:MFS family permease